MNVMCKLVDGIRGCCGRGSHGALQLATSCPCGDSFSSTAKGLAGAREHRPQHCANHVRHSPRASRKSNLSWVYNNNTKHLTAAIYLYMSSTRERSIGIGGMITLYFSLLHVLMD